MADTYKKAAEKKIKEIVSLLPAKEKPALEDFASRFFAKMPTQELAGLDARQAAFLLKEARDFIKTRTPGVPKIRIFTPVPEKAGFRRHRTVVELLNDDMPFLVDSITAELKRQGFTIFDTIHPLLTVKRDSKGALASFSAETEKEARRESLMVFVISSLPEDVSEKEMEATLQEVLAYIRHAVADWKPMLLLQTTLRDEVAGYTADAVDPAERDEATDFLTWLGHNNYVFLGYIEYDFYDKKGNEKLSVVKGSERGIFRVEGSTDRYKGLASIPQEVRHSALKSQLVEVSKSIQKSLVHRPVHMDYVSVKKLDAKGKVVGERRFVGLFTSLVYYQSAELIPYIRRKIRRAFERAGFAPDSHNGKALKAILEFYPRDELFQISEDDLYDIGTGLMALEARPEPRLFLRADQYGRFMSCLVFLPRDMFNTFVRKEITAILERAFNGSMTTFYTQMTESPLARIHLIIKTTPGQLPSYDTAKIEADIVAVISYWIDGLRELLLDTYGEQKGERTWRIFQNAFPRNYINSTTQAEALEDMEKLALSASSRRPTVRLYPECQGAKHAACQFRLNIYTTETETALSDTIPILEAMGCRVLDVHPFVFTPEWEHPSPVFLRQFELSGRDTLDIDLAARRPLFEETLERIWQGEMESDSYNALVLRAGLSWRQIIILRAYGKYLKQTGLSYNEAYMASALGAHPALAAALVKLFETRFDPALTKDREKAQAVVEAEILDRLTQVSNLAEDRIIRRFCDVILATLRTNFYQTQKSGQPKSYLSFKFDSAKVPELPLPRPYAEIFVYSLRTEGIHLRGGKVARGGLRWSDRKEDFRTEVLGLMKAQMVKNSVIVPVGSKGGFVVKQPPRDGSREALQEEGIACYKQFLSGLLDLTDNLKKGKIIPPKQVVRHDGDDPYLVVAADKGTATFSDIANGISEEYGFWLGDAFASGGSVGYDHKAMGITARGAWISVEQHFREMGRDIDKEDFTVLGIGDMSGDVFGNGMLLSRHIKLVAAFNHRHIFLDPSPDPAKSFKERERLFHLPRSGWTDYDATLISKGGGVYERSAKKIELSPQIRKLLGTQRESAPPDELIRLILKARADLLWNGGIGTYVKAEMESHADVGDSSNDAVRVNGSELRASVVGEGGNLGFTQKGRIEYARAGGRLNTDAIDNSAGVDCSDHEVNIKIALASAEQDGRLARAKRDALLASMTDEVAELVLKDNQLQNQALSIAQHQGHAALEAQLQMMFTMEEKGLLNREVERLPQNRDLRQLRAEKQGLTRPELAVLLSYAKIALFNDIADSSFAASPYLADELQRYFPEAMRKPFAEDINHHRLRREIIATVITNSIVNRAGLTFFHATQEETGRPGCDIARAYIIARDAFGLRDLWARIEATRGTVEPAVQIEMFLDINHLIERKTIWFLRHFPKSLDIEETMAKFAADIEVYRKGFLGFISPAIRKAYDRKAAQLMEKSVPAELASSIAAMEAMSSACSVISAAHASGLSVAAVGKVYYAIGARLELGYLRRKTSDYNADSHWDKIAARNLVTDFYDEQRRLTMAILGSCKSEKLCLDLVESWSEANKPMIDRYLRLIAEIRSTETKDLSMLSIALRQVRALGVGE